MPEVQQPLQTARLLIRLPELGDTEPLMDIFWDPEVVAKKQVTLTEPPGDLTQARRSTAAMIQHWESRGYGLWTVVESATQQVIGCVGLQNWKNWPGIELAWLLHRSRWGHGFATEAARAALQWTWDTREIDQVISLIWPHDLRSIRVATKIGERFERADVDPINGEPVHVYAVNRPSRITLSM
jgi:RimJ/RimL family protein N-acetyltransferase